MLPLQAMQGPENRLQCEKGSQVFNGWLVRNEARADES